MFLVLTSFSNAVTAVTLQESPTRSWRPPNIALKQSTYSQVKFLTSHPFANHITLFSWLKSKSYPWISPCFLAHIGHLNPHTFQTKAPAPRGRSHNRPWRSRPTSDPLMENLELRDCSMAPLRHMGHLHGGDGVVGLSGMRIGICIHK